MELYSASKICKTVSGITTRMIIDLVEKEVIKPARDSSGTGEHRLYSKDNIFDIMVAITMRGMFPSDMISALIVGIKKSSKTSPVQSVIMTPRNRTKKIQPAISFLHKGEGKSNDINVTLEESRKFACSEIIAKATGPINIVDTFTSVVVNVEAIQDFIEKKF